jgi:hypothetical protein
MPAANNFGDLGQLEDSFNSYLDALARGESRAADDVDPTLAETAVRVHAMAARTNAEIEMMRNVWSTVQAAAGGEASLSSMGIPGAPRVVSWSGERRRRQSWRFANHAAMAAVLIVALVTGYFGVHGGLPNGGSGGQMGGMLADPASTPYAQTGLACETEPKTVEEIQSVVATPMTPQSEIDGEITILPDSPDAETIEGVQHTQQQLIACAMEPLSQYALFTDTCLRSQLSQANPEEALKPEAVASAVAAEATREAEKLELAAPYAGTPGPYTGSLYEAVYADDIELLSDGRVGAVTRMVREDGGISLVPQMPNYRFFAKVGDRWLWDCDAPPFRG